MKEKFLDLWKTSALIQGTLALMFGATVCFLAIVGREIPGILLVTLGTVVGFFFRAKNKTTAA